MKKISNLLICSILFLLCSCDKSEDIGTNSSQKMKSTSHPIHNKTNNITYISESNFDSEFETFAQIFFSNHSLGSITIEHLPSEFQYKLTTEEESPLDEEERRILCRSWDKGTRDRCAFNYINYAIWDSENCEIRNNSRLTLNGNRVYETFMDCN